MLSAARNIQKETNNRQRDRKIYVIKFDFTDSLTFGQQQTLSLKKAIKEACRVFIRIKISMTWVQMWNFANTYMYLNDNV